VALIKATVSGFIHLAWRFKHIDTLDTYSFENNNKRGHGVNFEAVSNDIKEN
jgi:hypothetical protein